MGGSNQYTSGSNDSASDRTAHYMSISAERASTAHDLGDVRGKYYTVVGDTTDMSADYTGALIGCSAPDAAPDAVIKFSVSAGSAISVNFHLTKNDAYSDSSYGEWNPWSRAPGSDDPTPSTEFGAVVSVFRGDPANTGNTSLQCASDAQPASAEQGDPGEEQERGARGAHLGQPKR